MDRTPHRPHGRPPVHALLRATVVGAAFAAWMPATASADDSSEPTRHALEVAGGASSFDGFGRVRYRVRLPGGVQLGVVTRQAAVWQHIVVGYAVDSGYLGEARAELVVPLYDDGELWYGLELQPGVKWFVGPEGQGVDGDVDGSRAFVLDVAAAANVRVDDTWTVRAAVRFPFSLEVAPEVVNDVVGTLLAAGVTAGLDDRVQLFAELETGGLFGAGGDGPKFVLSGGFGLRVLFGGDAPARAWTTF